MICDNCKLDMEILVPLKVKIPYRVIDKEVCIRCFNDLVQGRILTIDN